RSLEMKKEITRREFVGASVAASLAPEPVVQTVLGRKAPGESSPPKARGSSPPGKGRYEGVQLTILDAWKQRHLEVFAGEFHALTGATVRFKRLDDIHGWWALETVAQADAVSKNPQLDIFLSDCNHTWTLWPHLLPLNDPIKTFDYD